MKKRTLLAPFFFVEICGQRVDHDHDNMARFELELLEVLDNHPPTLDQIRAAREELDHFDLPILFKRLEQLEAEKKNRAWLDTRRAKLREQALCEDLVARHGKLMFEVYIETHEVYIEPEVYTVDSWDQINQIMNAIGCGLAEQAIEIIGCTYAIITKADRYKTEGA